MIVILNSGSVWEKYKDNEDDPNIQAKLTVLVLKAKLKARGLTISGNKAVLITRLNDYITNVEGFGEEDNLKIIRNDKEMSQEELV